MFPEICSCLGVHKIGMQVRENTILLILQNMLHKEQTQHSTFMMQVTDHLQENAALGKAGVYLQMTDRETTIDVNDQANATDVVGKVYGLFVMENDNHKFCL